MRAVCEHCGGYGVTLRPKATPGEPVSLLEGPWIKLACENCDGRGWNEVRPWEEFEPMPETLALIERAEARR